jgi:putative chitinase
VLVVVEAALAGGEEAVMEPRGRGLLILDDGSDDARELRRLAAAQFPSFVAMGAEGDDDLETVVVPPTRVTLADGMVEAASREILWLAVPRDFLAPRDLLREAVLASADAVSEEVPGFVVLATNTLQSRGAYRRAAVVLDLADQETSGMLALAATGLAATTGARLDVLALGLKPGLGTSWEDVAAEVEFGRSKDVLRHAMLRARKENIQATWIPLGDPPRKVDAVRDFVVLENYDVVIAGVGDIRLGSRLRRGSKLEKALDAEAGGALALEILSEVECDVALVVDGVSTGAISPGVVRGSAVAGLALGSVVTGGLSTVQQAQAASLGTSTVAAEAQVGQSTTTTESNLSLITQAGVVIDADIGPGGLEKQVTEQVAEQEAAEQAAAEAAAEAEAAKGPLTGAELEQIAPTTPDELAQEYAENINLAMYHFNIDTPQQQAMFVAQIAHETDGFQTLEEYASGSAYEGNLGLGNTQPGDGERYKGRGAIQLTGRANYEAASQEFGVDFVANPELAASPEYAFEIAGWFWESNGLNGLADAGDFAGVTQRINGGMNGYDARVQYLEAASYVM